MLKLTRAWPAKSVRGTFINRSLTICSDGIHRRWISETKTKQEKLGTNFEEMMEHRYCEAKRSIVVQVRSQQSYNDLHAYCSRFGNIASSHYYNVKNGSGSENSNYILVEFEKATAATQALHSSTVRELDSSEAGTPVRSRFLWLASNNSNKQLKGNSTPIELNTGLVAEVNKEYLHECLLAAKSVSAQMQILYDNTHLNDLAVRIRFLAALQIEELFSGIYLDTRVYPFGSSVNGFGKQGSDLDVILKPLRDGRQQSQAHSSSRLFFHEKQLVHGKREIKKLEITALAQILAVLAPGIGQVVPIPKARIPIVKYYQALLGLHVDLSLSNMSGFYMSELLHIFGQIDDRVQPLVFTVRHWANQVNITRPGQMTNFPLTCLVLCFLQQLSQPILPTLRELERKTRIEDIRVTGNINCTFLRDLSQIQFTTENAVSLEELLIEFFDFFVHFDFAENALSLHSPKPIRKIDSSPMYIENPLERDLNVSKVVRHGELDRIQAIAESTLAQLVDDSVAPSSVLKRPWGIMNFGKNAP